ncbi:MAG: transposase [Gammaproteobacteria bacterium RIFOXYA12_FULL_61_12]|nr:MAG: transposase [Gammaproteobacteria bacterium RIFOXYA12_FULL_61_12]OGT91298.1 MAG: transposase [Gammaproteobacteria bacterium RIFOXYD12_FULL_61_37]
MPRLSRFILPGQPQHVIIRGNNRDPVFFAEEDYRFYLEKLKQACDKHRCDVHAYVLMTNHVHLLITPHTEQGIGKAIQMLGRYYVQYFNYNYNRTGTLWEGRYKATLIDSENYLLTCYRYIEINPVRAGGMVGHPSEYPWSSYRFNALGEDAPLVVPHEEYLRLGTSPAERQAAYRALFKAHIPDKTLDEIREATNKAWVLGSGFFKEKIEGQLNRPVSPRARGGDRKSKAHRGDI